VATEVLDAATTFEGYRLPELYCGFARGEGIEQESAPAAYPVSCSPQAWAAGSSLMILQALLGIEIEAGAGSMSTAPLLPGGVTKVHRRGMRVADNRLDLDVDDIKHSGHNAVGTSGMTLVGRDLKAEK
jgi:glycogen debranching enzyme